MTKQNRKNNFLLIKKHKALTILFGIILIIIIFICVITSDEVGGDVSKEAIIGKWDYDSYAMYQFNKDGTGSMDIDGNLYVFSYLADNGELYIDYKDEYVYDGKYKYSVKNNKLILIGKEGTDGKKYKLKRNMK